MNQPDDDDDDDASVHVDLEIETPEDCREFVTTLRRESLQKIELTMLADVSNFTDQTLLQDLDDALAASKVHHVRLEANEGSFAAGMLERLHLIQPLTTLFLMLDDGSVAPTSAGVATLLRPCQGSSQTLMHLTLYQVKFDGDFARGWEGLSLNETLAKIYFYHSSFDAMNRRAFESWLKDMKRDDVVVSFDALSSPPKGKLGISVLNCNFGNASIGSVASRVLEPGTKLQAIYCRDYYSNTDDTNPLGFPDLMRNLVEKSKGCGTPFSAVPRLILHLSRVDSVRRLCRALPDLTNLRHLSVYFDPNIPNDEVLPLKAALKLNGSLYSVEGADVAAYCERNQQLPETLAVANQDYEVNLLVPTLFMTAMQSPNISSNTILSAFREWDKNPVMGPSDEAAAVKARLLALKAYTAAVAASAAAATKAIMENEQADAANEAKMVATKVAHAARAKAAAAAETTAAANQNVASSSHVVDRRQVATALAAEATALQEAVDAEEKALVAIEAADVGTKRAAGADFQAAKAAKRAATAASKWAAAKATYNTN